VSRKAQSVRDLSGEAGRALRPLRERCFALAQKGLQGSACGEFSVTIFDCLECSIVRSPSQINSMFILQFKLILDHEP